LAQVTRFFPVSNKAVVFVVDADVVVRQSVSAIAASLQLRAELHCTAESFLEVFVPSRAGCVVLEQRLPGLSGLELLKKLHDHQPRLPAIVIAAQTSVAIAVQAMRSGAVHFFEKPCPILQLEQAIREAVTLDAHNRRQAAVLGRVGQRLARLSSGEQEVLELVLTGESNRGIASQLRLSTRAVEVRRAKVMQKMRAQSLAELVQMVLTVRQTASWKGPELAASRAGPRG
jgi:FixJ family two-component response regulator